MTASDTHQAVLLQEAVAALEVRADGCYVDGTFGRGGHSAAILAALGAQGRLLALDRDPQAVAQARSRFGADERFSIVHGSFTVLEAVVQERDWRGGVHGVLLDLGLSSPQVDNPERGFSFLRDGPLDMRMDPTCGEPAAVWLARVGEDELSRVLFQYGEERYARRIARAIVTRRAQAPLRRTGQLAELVAAAVPRRDPHKHPATRTFQAIRIAVNGELDALTQVLEQAVRVLARTGRLVVISFHSLEDRLVKRFIRRQASGGTLPVDLPVPADEVPATLRNIGKPVRPGAEEIAANPRARSAVMRVAERL